MVATYYSNEYTKNSPRAVHGDARETQNVLFTAPLVTALVANDVIDMGYLPPFARIIGACISSDQLDTGAGSAVIAFKVGDNGWSGTAADLARMFSLTTIGRVAGPANANASSAMDGKAQSFLNNQNAGLLIVATCTTAANIWLAGNLYLRVSYYIDEPVSGLNQ